MFTLQQMSLPGGDCTAPYSITFDKEYTLKEFVEAISTKTSEWGYIRASSENDIHTDVYHTFYKNGAIDVGMSDIIGNRMVRSACASGGWSRMDYSIRLKEEM